MNHQPIEDWFKRPTLRLSLDLHVVADLLATEGKLALVQILDGQHDEWLERCAVLGMRDALWEIVQPLVVRQVINEVTA